MVKEIRYTEIFYSLQGEGRFVGVPSVFFRTFGCNFRCMNFGLPRGTPKGRYNPEVAKLIEDKVHETTEKFEDLPLVHTGCDTYASIYPEFKHFNKTDDIADLPELLLKDVPNNTWTQPNGQDVHLIFTGGEPLLAWQTLYPDLLEQSKMRDLKNITFETNTTQLLRPDLYEYLDNYHRRFEVTFSCSPKLSVSGEKWEDAIKPEVARQYMSIPHSNLYLKFVVADKQDVEEVEQAVSEYRRALNREVPVYLMPLGGRSEEYTMTTLEVAKLAMEKGWRFTPRLHINLFGNAWGT
jgi:organic radical activating enzyme